MSAPDKITTSRCCKQIVQSGMNEWPSDVEYTRSDLIPAMLAEARAEGIREAIEAVAQADSAELTMHGVTPTLMRLQALIAQEDRSDD